MASSTDNGEVCNPRPKPQRSVGGSGNGNGRRVWVPRTRGNPISNPNSSSEIVTENPNLNSNLRTSLADNFNVDMDPNVKHNSKCNWQQSKNRSFDGSSSNFGAQRKGFEAYGSYGQMSVDSEIEERSGMQLSSGQINWTDYSENSKDFFQLGRNCSVGIETLPNRETQPQRPSRGAKGRRQFDKIKNNRRVEVSAACQNGASENAAQEGSFESNYDHYNDRGIRGLSTFGQSSSNEYSMGPSNGRRHFKQSIRQSRHECVDHGVGNLDKDLDKYSDMHYGASSYSQNFSNEDIIGAANSKHPSEQWRHNGKNKNTGAGNNDRNVNNFDHRDNGAYNIRSSIKNIDAGNIESHARNSDKRYNGTSNIRQMFMHKDLVVQVDGRKDSSQSIPNGRPGMKNLGNRSTKSSQDWRCLASSPFKQEDVQGMHLNKSNVPQLVQEIEQKLHKGKAECMICYEIVGRSAPMWSCDSCYAIFHLHCIKKWARAPTSTDLSASGKDEGSNWRCPGCQAVQYSRAESLRYYCFCGKMHDPSTDLYLTPHSCGESCGKPLYKGNKMSHCPHTCILQCHPGPCPPCMAMAPPESCPCGKNTTVRRCSEQKLVESCGQECGKPLSCGRHYCDKMCHQGSCGSCKVLINASCFCERKEKTIRCGDIEIQGELQWKYGVYSCENLCMKVLSCKNHKCNLGCHPGDCGDCDLLPVKIRSCPCGKTELQIERTSCLDPVPTCSQVCEKLLPCGKHSCENTCHQGACPPCFVSVDEKCRCGSSSRTVPCCKAALCPKDDEEFLCQKMCGLKKSCGRHRCSDKCCPLAHQGCSTIQSSDWDPHLCQMLCGKKLRCGQHFCQELCHSGHCPPCLETIFTDLACACGKTSIPPPVPCGTPIPSCTYPCSVPQPCGHLTSHNCHPGECPPCTAPIEKKCVGNHVILRNVPCGSRDIRCNNFCGKTRQCGMHACAKPCHLPPCDPDAMENSSSLVTKSCGQTCGAQRRDCKHACTALCHPSTPCPDTRCTFPVSITCSCGRLIAQVPCDAGGSNLRSDPVFEANVLHKLPVPLQPLEPHLGRVPLGQRNLACDEECAKLEKKRVLADAFDISTTVDLPGLNGGTSEMLAGLIRREPQWVAAVEERFRYLVLGRTKANIHNAHGHVFSAMPKEKRDILRQLAARWNLSVFSAGWEPRRFLIVQATQKSKAPLRNLLFKGPHQTTGQVQRPAFNALVDMDPRLVLALFDLPREADVSSLILRFGGECELVWLNDKNALAIFTDPARASTALRRVDHASAYQGAVVVPQTGGLPGGSAWGTKEGGIVEKSVRLQKKTLESAWMDSWGEDSSITAKSNSESNSIWQLKNKPITTTRNPWVVLDGELGTKSSSSHAQLSSKPPIIGDSMKEASSQENQNKLFSGKEEVEDWEAAFD